MNRNTAHTSTAHTNTVLVSGLDRRSCSWRDALGPGFATGARPALLGAVSNAAHNGYCG